MRLPAVLAALALLTAPAFAQETPPDSTAEPVPTVLDAPREPYRVPPRPTPPATTGRPAPAPTPPAAPRVFDPFGEFGLAFGGDDVATLVFTDGSDQTLTAGQGGVVTVGARVRPVATVPVSALASVGFKFLLNASNNADVRLTRVPVEVGLAVDVTPDVWAEVAAVRHLGAELKGDGFFRDVPFESSTGVRAWAGWRWIGGGYTAIRYTADDGSEFDASHVGLSVRVRASDF